MKKISTESPTSDASQKLNEMISGDSSLFQSSISLLSNRSGDLDSDTYEQNGSYSTSSSSAHSPSRPAATIDNKEEEISYADFFCEN